MMINILQLSDYLSWCGLLKLLFIQLIWQFCLGDIAKIAYKEGN